MCRCTISKHSGRPTACCVPTGYDVAGLWDLVPLTCVTAGPRPYASVVAAVTAVNDYQKQLQFEKLNAIAQGSEQVRSLRDGCETILNVTDLLVGRAWRMLLATS